MTYVSNHIRFAVVKSVDYDRGLMRTTWLDSNGEDGPDVPIPHPAQGRGEGIFSGIRPGMQIALDLGSYERYVPTSIVPMRAFTTSDISYASETRVEDVTPPHVEEGEICIQGPAGGRLYFNRLADVTLVNRHYEGLVLGGDEDKEHRCSIQFGAPVGYCVSQAGLKAEGIVRRDLRDDESDFDTAIADPMTDIDFEQILEEVGRDPSKAIAMYTRHSGADNESNAMSTDQFKNPPFVERRTVMNEFGADWRIGTQDEEEALLRGEKNMIAVRIADDRRERRTNILSLSYAFPNELMESVDGTLVDLFGNLLDANRHALPLPNDKNEKQWFEAAIENAQHTIAIHREINSRKGWGYRSDGLSPFKHEVNPQVPGDSSNNARDRSRWFLDVDKEGFTKVNIPATSETGVVPVLARYENSSTVVVDEGGEAGKSGRPKDDIRALFRPSPEKMDRRDIFLDQFGPGGITVSGQSPGGSSSPVPSNRLAGEKTSWIESKDGSASSRQTLPGIVQAGTAFHDITRTAVALLNGSINKSSDQALGPAAILADPPAVFQTVNRAVPDRNISVLLDKFGRPVNAPYAGGRSLQANLDGSLEMSVGANTVDRLSLTMNTAGGVAARIGRDRMGRSMVMQADGTIALEVGGFDFVGSSSGDTVDTRFSGGGVLRKDRLPKDQTVFRSGKVVIRVRRKSLTQDGPDESADDQVIIIDENGMSIEVAGRMNFVSKGDMTFKTGSRFMVDAEAIQLYNGNAARFVIKNNKKI